MVIINVMNTVLEFVLVCSLEWDVSLLVYFNVLLFLYTYIYVCVCVCVCVYVMGQNHINY